MSLLKHRLFSTWNLHSCELGDVHGLPRLKEVHRTLRSPSEEGGLRIFALSSKGLCFPTFFMLGVNNDSLYVMVREGRVGRKVVCGLFCFALLESTASKYFRFIYNLDIPLIDYRLPLVMRQRYCS